VRNKNAVLKDYLFLSLTIYFGVLTHYHFVVWASLVLIFFFTSAIYINVILKSFISILTGVTDAILTFPILSNPFNSIHKKWLDKQSFDFEKFKSLCNFFNLYTEGFFLIDTKIVILLLLFLGSLAYIKNFFLTSHSMMSQKEPVHLTPTQFKFNDKNILCFLYTALSFLFIIIVAFTSQYKSIRYSSHKYNFCFIFD
jgi:hypothetical protein